MIGLDRSWDASWLAAEIRAGRRSTRETVETLLERIADRDPLIGAWVHIDPDRVRREADFLDKVEPVGPLHGLPIGIKDVIATRDFPTEYGSPIYAGNRPDTDAACVRLLRRAGALILGKTATVELASIGNTPRTRNPHAPDHTPGGSSSGSAAAVADAQAPLALGTQTGGSMIRPASFCGVWAMKPSWGSVCTEGVKPFAPSLDTLGWFGRSARDLRLLLDLFAPAPNNGPATRTLRGARFALWRTPAWHKSEEASAAAIDNLVRLLTAAGAKVEEVGFEWPDLLEDHRVIMHAEGQRSFLPEYRSAADHLHPRIQTMVEQGGGRRKRVRLAHDRAAMARAAYDLMAADFSAVISPSSAGPAPEGLENTGDLSFNGLLTLLHVPVVNLPLYSTSTGLPVGVSLSAPRYCDAELLAWAQAIGDLV